MSFISNAVIEFVAAETLVDVGKISPSTSINHDLGVAGDDGVELLNAFAEKFDVDMSGLQTDYFGAEASGNPFSLLRGAFLLLMGRKGEANSGLPSLPVSVLIESAEQLKWMDRNA